jgi:hypothetical protein
MKKFIPLGILLGAAYVLLEPGPSGPVVEDAAGLAGALSESDRILAEAFERHLGNLQVRGQGRVTRILADDLDGRRHQRFILRLDSGQTLLVAHNIDLAPRVDPIRAGDLIMFFGEYEWNPEGGVIHWTHHDPRRRHPDGWLIRDRWVHQ